jgi:rhomboid protease GluP
MLPGMFKRQTTGSVVCVSCGSLVGVNDPECYNCGRRNPGLWGYAPLLRQLGNDLGFVNLIIYGSSILYVLSLLITVMFGGNILGGGGPMSILSPGQVGLTVLGASGAIPVFVRGWWWTVLSAGWLHAGILHILFNMMWVRNLGPATADIYGGPRMVIIYTVSSIAGFLMSSVLGLFPLPLFGAAFTVGASAPIFGLLGALVHYGRRGGSSMVLAEASRYAVILFIFGLVFPGVDNAAHAGGFIGGYLASLWLDPFRPERVHHMLWAAICLAATFLSILISAFLTLSLLGVFG